ncbi:MAG: methylmalonyl-CoA mutase subunit beta [Bacteroidota bacterium]
MSNKELFEDFDDVSSKLWKQKVQFDLKGKDYNDTLVWESLEGIHVKPFYHPDSTNEALGLMEHSPKSWKIAQEIYANDVSKTLKNIDRLKQEGVESFLLTIPDDQFDLNRFLQAKAVENTEIHIKFPFLHKAEGLPKTSPSHHLHMDVIGHFAREGNWLNTAEKDLEQTISNVKHPNYRCAIHSELYQNSGANCIQQLAYSLAHATEYLNHFETHKVGSNANFSFFVGVGGNYFFEIAKMKALRLLWETVSKNFGVNPNCTILAMPSLRNKTLYDFNTNMLRTTTESMAAVLGGADVVCNLNYDSVYHKTNAFAERAARNQLLLLKEESFFESGSMPTEGSYYVENLTVKLAEKALELFKEIEASGGFIKMLHQGTIQKKIKQSAEKEQALFDKGELVLVGSNKYANANDRMKDSIERAPFPKKRARKTLIEPIVPKRLSSGMEMKRLDQE